jgi:hypothetical protein
MNAKTCRQCGELKPLAQYRQYYGGRTGHYTTCKQCEKINSRLKYLESKQTLTEPERVERDKILKLYEVQQAAGLRPPRRGVGRTTKLVDDLDQMISKYAQSEEVKLPADIEAPFELVNWLSCELTDEPDVYLDVVYESLNDKFRPVIRIDTATMMPVRDETYRPLLDKILQRFYDYEESYYEEDK